VLYPIPCSRIIGANGSFYAFYIAPFCPQPSIHSFNNLTSSELHTRVFKPHCLLGHCDRGNSHVRNAQLRELRSRVLIPVVSKPRRRACAQSLSSSCKHILEQLNILDVDELARFGSRRASFSNCDVETIESGKKVVVNSQPRLAVVQGPGARVRRHPASLHHQVCSSCNTSPH
jgi:hypothetical protein